ncbi:MAG: DUF4845 domain-containing protein [Gammaproteobacteria bacterium]
MNTINKQRGMSAIGLVIVLLLIGFFTLITLRVGPMYLENFSVTSSLASLKNEPDIAAKPGIEILQLLMKRLDINDVENVNPKDIAITRISTGVLVSVKYEVRKALVGNFDVVGKFDESVELNQR